MKRLSLIPVVTISAFLAFDAQQAAAAVPFVDGKGIPASTTCPAGLVAPAIIHFDKIVFQITGALLAVNAADQNAMDALPRQTPLDIKVYDNPKRVADLDSKVLTFLNAQVTTANRQAIQIGDVTYATAVCNP